MPCRAEAALAAIGIIGDDIDGRNACHLVHGNVVVGDATAVAVGEKAAIAGLTGRAPHLLDNLWRVLHGELLPIELCPHAANHVEQYAIAGFVVCGQVTTPVLRAQSPRVSVIGYG